MHRELVDELDYGFSPADGIAAIDDLFGDLPKVHRSRAGQHRGRQQPKSLRVYTGCFAWYPLGFSYVQIGQELHVLELWMVGDTGRPSAAEVDSVVGIHNA